MKKGKDINSTAGLSINQIRKSIDKIDAEILDLINKLSTLLTGLFLNY